MKVFITGIAGFLGSHLADLFVARGDDIDGMDDFSTGDTANFHGAALWKEDIADIKPERLAGVDVVFHCAAAAYEGASHFAPAFISRNIYAGSAAVFGAAITAGVRRIVFASSMARYGEPYHYTYKSWAAFSEDQLPHPVDPYGIAKEAAERLLINLCQTHGVEWSIAVPHNIYGPRQRFYDPYRNVAAIMVNRMLLGERPVIYGDGDQVRCFSYVDDVVPTLARMGLDHAANGEVINVGPDEGAVTVFRLGHKIADILNVPYNPIFLPPRPREVRHAVCSSDKARRLLGFEQRTALRDGLARLVEYVRQRGPRPFEYHLPLEINSPLTPTTWSDRSM